MRPVLAGLSKAMSERHIAHLTSVHVRYDTRIFLKECVSLASAGYQVSLVVADGRGDEQKKGVAIHDVGASHGRWNRIRHAPGRILRKALALDAELYHLHDPELIPIGLKLKRGGRKVVFDAHEDLPRQVLNKPYLNPPLRWVLAQVLKQFEFRTCGRFDAVVTATPSIRDKFLAIEPLTVDVNNFPILGELSSETVDWPERKARVCYLGGISEARGIREIVKAMEHLQSAVRLQLAGTFSEKTNVPEIKAFAGWRRVDELGFLGREAVREVLASSMAGVVTFHPFPNHINAQPNKMFEYMSAGIPVIASDFPLWRDIVAGNDCGLCVDPRDPRAIAEAVDFLAEHPQRAEEMGRNGQEAVRGKYNWDKEFTKLLSLYHGVLR